MSDSRSRHGPSAATAADERVRIQDVARASGVSIKTVSRVLNNEPDVRDATRRRVHQMVEVLEYRPNRSARSLAGHKAYLLALLYDNPSANYVMEVLTGVAVSCRQHHYGMVLHPLDYGSPRLVADIESLLRQSKLDGVLLTPPITDSDAVLECLARLRMPYACVSPRNRDEAIGVHIDEEEAAGEMVAHLISLGHRRIAHIRGHPAQGASIWRLNGYRNGLERAGLRYDPTLVVDGLFTFDSGVAAAERLLDLAQPPTAIFAANDDTAAGVLSVLHRRGLSIPGDVSVCGFDDSPMSAQIFPSLTTVHQPTREMGHAATEQLLKAIRRRAGGRMMRLPYSLVLRQSTGPAPAA